MGTVTYPNSDVIRIIDEHFLPVQLDVTERPEVKKRFNAPWTPTILVFDADGREQRRSEGYLDPKRFVSEVAIGRGKAALNLQDFAAARERFRDARDLAKGDRAREPEALYWHSVAGYKATDDAQVLMRGWNELLEGFPDSEWAKKAEFIRRK